MKDQLSSVLSKPIVYEAYVASEQLESAVVLKQQTNRFTFSQTPFQPGT